MAKMAKAQLWLRLCRAVASMPAVLSLFLCATRTRPQSLSYLTMRRAAGTIWTGPSNPDSISGSSLDQSFQAAMSRVRWDWVYLPAATGASAPARSRAWGDRVAGVVIRNPVAVRGQHVIAYQAVGPQIDHVHRKLVRPCQERLGDLHPERRLPQNAEIVSIKFGLGNNSHAPEVKIEGAVMGSKARGQFEPPMVGGGPRELLGAMSPVAGVSGTAP